MLFFITTRMIENYRYYQMIYFIVMGVHMTHDCITLKQIVHLHKHLRIKTLTLLLVGILLIAHGVRLIYQGVFEEGSSHSLVPFNLLFDWATIIIFCSIISYYIITILIKKYSDLHQGRYKIYH
jgi:hypothetical protein